MPQKNGYDEAAILCQEVKRDIFTIVFRTFPYGKNRSIIECLLQHNGLAAFETRIFGINAAYNNKKNVSN